MPDKRERPPAPEPSVPFNRGGKISGLELFILTMFWLVAIACIGLITSLPAHAPTLAESTVYVKIGDMGHGSAVHIGNGYLLTAAHVADQQEVTDDDGQPVHMPLSVIDTMGRKHKAEVLWVNHTYDVALLRMTDAKLVASSDLSCRYLDRGEKLTFAGNPLGLKNITTYGQVANPNIISYGPWKAINSVSGQLLPGMSGGPVFDGVGHVVGINVGLAVDPQLARDREGHPVASYEMAFALSFIVPGRTLCQLMDR